MDMFDCLPTWHRSAARRDSAASARASAQERLMRQFEHVHTVTQPWSCQFFGINLVNFKLNVVNVVKCGKMW